MPEGLCPNCGKENRKNAKFCQQCGQPLPQSNQVASEPPAKHARSGLLSELRGEFEYLREDARGVLQSLSSAIKGEPKESLQDSQSSPGVTGNPPHRQPQTRLIPQTPTAKKVGDQFGGYVILRVWPLSRTNYYQVRQIRCPQGHENSADISVGRCSVCNIELSIYLAHERFYDPGESYSDRQKDLIQLSQAPSSGIQKHNSIFSQDDRLYVITDFPSSSWSSMAQVNIPVWDYPLLIQWVQNLGEALKFLASQRFVPRRLSPSDVLEPVIAIGAKASLADLTLFKRISASSSDAQVNSSGTVHGAMIAFLSQLIYILSSGRPQTIERAPRDFSDVPAPFRDLLRQAVQNEMSSIDEFLEKLRESLVVPEARRSLRQIAGYRSDVGRQREQNEDFVGKYTLGMQQTSDTPEIGLYIVADGMGGHQAGEVASQDVVRVILEEIQEKAHLLQSTPKVKRSTIKLDGVISASEVLKQSILRANEIVFNARQQVGSDRGTTITAALIIGPTSAIANVGDSRTYLLRENQLRQLTKDHSLVASLLEANVIKPDEVRVHPERSRIFRNLGEKLDVEVDIYEVQLQVKDRLLLCSDGLWEMVLDTEIQQILQTSADPQEACDRLVDAANLAGGQDNISAICIWMR